MNREFGIAWSRTGDDILDKTTDEIHWFESLGETRQEFHRREDKYWPSAIVEREVGPVTILERGEAPEYLRD